MARVIVGAAGASCSNGWELGLFSLARCRSEKRDRTAVVIRQ